MPNRKAEIANLRMSLKTKNITNVVKTKKGALGRPTRHNFLATVHKHSTKKTNDVNQSLSATTVTGYGSLSCCLFTVCLLFVLGK